MISSPQIFLGKNLFFLNHPSIKWSLSDFSYTLSDNVNSLSSVFPSFPCGFMWLGKQVFKKWFQFLEKVKEEILVPGIILIPLRRGTFNTKTILCLHWLLLIYISCHLVFLKGRLAAIDICQLIMILDGPIHWCSLCPSLIPESSPQLIAPYNHPNMQRHSRWFSCATLECLWHNEAAYPTKSLT